MTRARNTANLGYVDAVKKSGDEMSGFLTLSNSPTAALHAVNKQYVDTAGEAAYCYFTKSSITETVNNASPGPTEIVWDTEVVTDSLFIHSTSTSADKIHFTQDGYYIIDHNIEWITETTDRTIIKTELYIDNVAVSDTVSYDYGRGDAYNDSNTHLTTTMYISAGQWIDIRATQDYSDGTNGSTNSTNSYIKVSLFSPSKGEKGDTGDTGDKGDQGDSGYILNENVPSGGLVGQVITKSASADFAIEWAYPYTISSAGPPSGSVVEGTLWLVYEVE